MKTLNKTLSLTLVFALVFSLMSFAFAADTTTTTAATKLSDFTDADQLTYTEAADYLIAAGIVKGDTATTLNPKASFQRDQAAKLVAYAALGQTAADNLKTSVAPFKDVAADNWAAGYIAYCQKQGFVNGYGDGNYGPTDKVTGYQIAKMLLCSIGYGVNGEFTGSGWELAVAPVALSYGIFTGNAAGASATAATREEAFLYTFNTLSSLRSVTYNKTLGVYYVAGAGFTATNPKSATIGTSDDTREDTIGAIKFGMTRANASSGSYGQARHTWQLNGTTKTGKYNDEKVTTLATSANGTSLSDLTTKGKTGYIGYDADDTSSTAYYLNGDTSSASAVATVVAKRGNVVNFIDTDKDGSYNSVEVFAYSIAKLSSDPTIKTSGSLTSVTMADLGMSKIDADDITGDYASLKENDYVLYYSNAAKTDWTVEKATTVSGQLYGYNASADGLNINGTSYYRSGIDGAADMSDFIAVSGLAGSTFYLDKGQSVAGVESSSSTVAASNSVFLLKAADNGLDSVTAKLLKSNGTVITKTIAKLGTTTVTDDTQLPDNTFYTYVENSDGTFTLKTIDGALQKKDDSYATDAAVFTKGKAAFWTTDETFSTLGTNSTAFVVESSAGTYKAYTGVSNVPNITKGTDTVTAAVLNDSKGYAIFAVALGGKLSNTSSNYDYVFVGSSASTVNMTASDTYYSYAYAVKNGEIKAVDAENDDMTAGGLYAVDSYTDGRVDHTIDTPASDNLISADLAGATATSFSVNGTTVTYTALGQSHSFIVSDNCKVFIWDATNSSSAKVSLDAGTLAGLKNLTGSIYQLKGLKVSSTDPTIAELYVTIAPKELYSAAAFIAYKDSSPVAQPVVATGSNYDSTNHYEAVAITATDADKLVVAPALASSAVVTYGSSLGAATTEYTDTGITVTSGTPIYVKIVTTTDAGETTMMYQVTVTNS